MEQILVEVISTSFMFINVWLRFPGHLKPLGCRTSWPRASSQYVIARKPPLLQKLVLLVTATRREAQGGEGGNRLTLPGRPDIRSL